jgi:hypothetical protein
MCLFWLFYTFYITKESCQQSLFLLVCNCGILYHVSDEELLKWGWPEDVWFHVDKVSSAHVYLRLHPVRTHIHFKRYLAVIRDAPNMVHLWYCENYDDQ